MSLRLTRKFREGGEKNGSLRRGWFGTLPRRKSLSLLVQQDEVEAEAGPRPDPGIPAVVQSSNGTSADGAPERTPPASPDQPAASNGRKVRWDDVANKQCAAPETLEPLMSGACVTPDRPAKRHSGHSLTKGLRNTASYLHISPTKSLSKAFKSLRSPRKENHSEPGLSMLSAEDERMGSAEAPVFPAEFDIPTISDVMIPSCGLVLPSQPGEPANDFDLGESAAEVPRNSEPNRHVPPSKSTVVTPLSRLKQHCSEQETGTAELNTDKADEAGQRGENGCNSTSQMTLAAILNESPSQTRDFVDNIDQRGSSSTVPKSTEADKKFGSGPLAATAASIAILEAHPGTPVLYPRRPSIQRTTSLRRDLDRLVKPASTASSDSRKPSGAYKVDLEDNMNNSHEADKDGSQHRSASPTPSVKKFHGRKRTIIPWKMGATSRDNLPSQQGLAGLSIGLRQSSEQLRLLQRNSQDGGQSTASACPSSMLGREAQECKTFRLTLDPVDAEVFREYAERGIMIEWVDGVDPTMKSPFDDDNDDDDREDEMLTFDQGLAKARIDPKWTSGGKTNEQEQRMGTRGSIDSGLGSSIVSGAVSNAQTQGTGTATDGSTRVGSVFTSGGPSYELSATTPSVGIVKNTAKHSKTAISNAIVSVAKDNELPTYEQSELENRRPVLEQSLSPAPALAQTIQPDPATHAEAPHSTTVEVGVDDRSRSIAEVPITSESFETFAGDISALERYLVGGPLTTLKTGHRHRPLYLPANDDKLFPERMISGGWRLPDPAIPLFDEYHPGSGSGTAGYGHGGDGYHCMIRTYDGMRNGRGEENTKRGVEGGSKKQGNGKEREGHGDGDGEVINQDKENGNTTLMSCREMVASSWPWSSSSSSWTPWSHWSEHEKDEEDEGEEELRRKVEEEEGYIADDSSDAIDDDE